MSLVLLRVTLLSLLLMTVFSKTQTTVYTGQEWLVGNVLEVLVLHRVSAQANATQTGTVLPVLVQFEVPGCDGSVEIRSIHINLQEAPMLKAVIKPNHMKQFAYLDQTWHSENRLGMRLTWLRHRLLSLLGLSRFVTGSEGLLIVSPPGCHAAEDIDWSLVWDRRTVVAVDRTKR